MRSVSGNSGIAGISLARAMQTHRHAVNWQLRLLPRLFAADEDVLSENTDVIIRRASEMSIDQQFDYLAKWVLPSNTRMTVSDEGHCSN